MLLDAVLFIATFGRLARPREFLLPAAGDAADGRGVWRRVVQSGGLAERPVGFPVGLVPHPRRPYGHAAFASQPIAGSARVQPARRCGRASRRWRRTRRPRVCSSGRSGWSAWLGAGAGPRRSRRTRRGANLAGCWCGRNGHLLHRVLGERVQPRRPGRPPSASWRDSVLANIGNVFPSSSPLLGLHEVTRCRPSRRDGGGLLPEPS